MPPSAVMYHLFNADQFYERCKPGKKKIILGPYLWIVRIIGVFDTVGSVGMPEELCLSSEKLKNIFGFPDKHLGHHVERAYQALALNEDRVDFVCHFVQY